jgi:hypothetical protein
MTPAGLDAPVDAIDEPDASTGPRRGQGARARSAADLRRKGRSRSGVRPGAPAESREASLKIADRGVEGSSRRAFDRLVAPTVTTRAVRAIVDRPEAAAEPGVRLSSVVARRLSDEGYTVASERGVLRVTAPAEAGVLVAGAPTDWPTSRLQSGGATPVGRASRRSAGATLRGGHRRRAGRTAPEAAARRAVVGRAGGVDARRAEVAGPRARAGVTRAAQAAGGGLAFGDAGAALAGRSVGVDPVTPAGAARSGVAVSSSLPGVGLTPVLAHPAQGRDFDATMGAVHAPATQVGSRRANRFPRAVPRRRGAVTGQAGSAADAESAAAAHLPGWAERMARPEAAPPEPAVGGRLRTSGGLINALARAGRAEDVVRVILERGDAAESLSGELPGEAGRLVRRIAGAAASDAEPTASTLVQGRGESPTATTVRNVRRDVLTPVRTYGGGRAAGRASAKSSQGVGSSNAMKLASRLMKLIHLAESERRMRDAQAQVRMAEDTAEARAEGGAGASGRAGKEEQVDIKALQQEVLEAVLSELERLQSRREDPDGRSKWW